eukprot:scaffold7791_cov457-Prasinococcus_capsulatus_cf.AAC.1
MSLVTALAATCVQLTITVGSRSAPRPPPGCVKPARARARGDGGRRRPPSPRFAEGMGPATTAQGPARWAGVGRPAPQRARLTKIAAWLAAGARSNGAGIGGVPSDQEAQ